MKYKCKTISKSVREVITKDKGSKFIGFAFPVDNEDEVKEKLSEIREIYPDATHHCYAYRLNFDGEDYRANDDGEPNGTAGLPIYNQLLSKGLTFILLIVVRYYGGTKLGVSGLIRAYKENAEATLAEAKERIIHKKKRYILQFPYTSQSDAMRSIQKFQGEIINQTYMEDCQLEIEIHLKKDSSFLAQIQAYPDIQIEPCE